MNKLQVRLNFRGVEYEVGRLFLSEDLGRYVFNYDASFVSTGLELSPYVLPLSNQTFVADRNTDLYNLHNLFAGRVEEKSVELLSL